MGRGSRGLKALIAAVALTLAVPALAFAHLERPSYWPDPAPDTSVSPPAGGAVPKVRPLSTAVSGKGPGDVRVVCAGADGRKSLKLLAKSVKKAEKKGFKLRPSQDRRKLSKKKGAKLTAQNEEARQAVRVHRDPAGRLRFRQQRPVVIMPGRYKEPTSRKEPINDPECADMTQQDSSGAETPSYRYQTPAPTTRT